MSKVFSLLIVLAVVISLSPQPVHAATTVSVPAGTRVALQFRSGLDSSTAKEGQRVNFRVAANVIVNRLVVIREGASARGTITDVTPPGVLGKSARIIISFVTATAVDGRPVRLSSIYITPNDVRGGQGCCGRRGRGDSRDDHSGSHRACRRGAGSRRTRRSWEGYGRRRRHGFQSQGEGALD